MTESIDWNDGEDDDDRQNDADPSIIERFKRYLAARKTAGLGPNDPDTDDTERLRP